MILRSEVERRVLDGLGSRLLHPALLAEFIAEYHREWNLSRKDEEDARAASEAELKQVIQKIDQIVTAITDGMYHPSMKEKMDALEARKAELQVKRPDPADDRPPLRLHPGLADIYRNKIGALSASLNAESTRMEAAELLRGLISEVRLYPDASAPDGHAVELYGELAAILNLAETPNDKTRRLTGGASDSMVAGTGFGLHRTTALLDQRSETFRL